MPLKWRGPWPTVRVISIFVFEIEDLDSGHLRTLHSSRLRFYQDLFLDVTADILKQIAHNGTGCDFRATKDLRYNPDKKQYAYAPPIRPSTSLQLP
jgi:hypothetical protein